MTIYELINEKYTLNTLVELIRNNITVDILLINHMAVYEKYMSLEGPKMARYELLGKEFKLHPKTIQKIILKFNEEAR